MGSPDSALAPWSPRVLSVLRIMAALLYMQHGGQKLLGFPAAMKATPSLLSLTGVAGALEFLGGMLLLLGLFSRPAAFLLSGEMAVAYFTAHFPRGFWPLLNGGELAVLYCFLYLYLAVAGGGEWSLDAVRARKWGR